MLQIEVRKGLLSLDAENELILLHYKANVLRFIHQLLCGEERHISNGAVLQASLHQFHREQSLFLTCVESFSLR